MSFDSAHRPLYLRASNVAQASDDADAFWPSLQERMTSCNANASAAADGEQEAVDDDERAPPPEDDEFWLALQDRTASRINEDATAANGRGREIDQRVFADLVGCPQKPAERRQSEESWLQGFARLDDTFAFAKRGEDVDKSVIPGLVSIPSSDSETEPETDSDDESFVLAGSQPIFAPHDASGAKPSPPSPRSNAKQQYRNPHNLSPSHHHHHPSQAGHHQHHQPHPPTVILQKGSVPAAAGGPPSRGRKPWIPPTQDYRHHHNPQRGGHHAPNNLRHVSNNNGIYNHKDIERQGGGPRLYQNQVAQAGGGGGSVPPPGFRPGGGPEPTLEEGPYNVETNPMAMLRATAREFVPTSFKPTPSPAPGEANHAVPSMSSQPATHVTTAAPAANMSTPPPSRPSSTSINQAAVNQIRLAGLNFTSFMGEQNNNTEGNTGNNKTTWGTSTGGAGGSIW